jgi:hypothetical protein
MMWLSTFTVWLVLNVAVALTFPLIATMHALSPEHTPLQPAKYDPLAATAFSFTFVPEAKAALHVGLQLIPPGAPVTVPEPVPATLTFSA